METKIFAHMILVSTMHVGYIDSVLLSSSL